MPRSTSCAPPTIPCNIIGCAPARDWISVPTFEDVTWLSMLGTAQPSLSALQFTPAFRQRLKSVVERLVDPNFFHHELFQSHRCSRSSIMLDQISSQFCTILQFRMNSTKIDVEAHANDNRAIPSIRNAARYQDHPYLLGVTPVGVQGPQPRAYDPPQKHRSEISSKTTDCPEVV